mmetsp:Transcript_6176/g.17707  ORF Transcript_6176/g.17707 Transcript_6176/m.17707 type:complete len:265 (+) Transcript_6176:267-1061(+)
MKSGSPKKTRRQRGRQPFMCVCVYVCRHRWRAEHAQYTRKVKTERQACLPACLPEAPPCLNDTVRSSTHSHPHSTNSLTHSLTPILSLTHAADAWLSAGRPHRRQARSLPPRLLGTADLDHDPPPPPPVLLVPVRMRTVMTARWPWEETSAQPQRQRQKRTHQSSHPHAGAPEYGVSGEWGDGRDERCIRWQGGSWAGLMSCCSWRLRVDRHGRRESGSCRCSLSLFAAVPRRLTISLICLLLLLLLLTPVASSGPQSLHHLLL